MALEDELPPTIEAECDASDPTVREELKRLAVPDGHAGLEKERVFSSLHGKMFGEADPVRIGRFVVEARLGSGAMGVVYAARDPELGRRVAIKVLRDPSRSEEATARLEREARSLARLRHEHVVTVYEVGTHAGDRFIAMDLVEGDTLRKWLAERPRSWKEILDVFLQAGQGLAAAHDAGLVHRDFKPDNVLVEDGQARVADFGLARPAGEASLDGTDLDEVSSSELTRTGTILGTPAYMAPEAFGGEADAAADQFAFCVSLYEALYGARPFAGKSVSATLGAILEGRVDKPPRNSAPPWLRKVVLRGLAYEPRERWPTMRALLEEIERRRRRPYARALAVAAVGGTAVGALAMQFADPDRPACVHGADRLGDVWNEPRRRTIEKAFAGTELPYAEAAWTTAAATLDAYAEQWRRMQRDACVATYERGEQSEAMFEAKMHCLQRRLDELDALAVVFEEPDEPVVSRAVDATRRLRPLDDCADEHELRVRLLRGEGLDVREPPAELYHRLAAATIAYTTGGWQEALPDAEVLATEADEGGYLELAAEAHDAVSWLREYTGDLDGAIESTRATLDRAERLGDDKLRFGAQKHLIALWAAENELDRADEWIRFTESTIKRIGDTPPQRAGLLQVRSNVSEAAGNYQEVLEQRLELLALRESFLPPGDPMLAASHRGLSIVYGDLGNYEQSLHHAEIMFEIQTELLSEHHPRVADAHVTVANALMSLGRMSEASEHLRLALEIAERAQGPYHVQVGRILVNLGNVIAQGSNQTEAIPYFRRAVEIFEVARGPDDRLVAIALGNLGRVLAFEKDTRDAVAVLTRALRIYERVLGPDHADLLYPLNSLVVAYTTRGELPEALATARRALKLGQASFGATHPLVADAWFGVGRVQLEMGQYLEAATSMEHAIAGHHEGESVPAAEAEVEAQLALAYEGAGQRNAAVDAAERARELYAADENTPRDSHMRAIDAWLAEHPRR